MTRLGRSEAVLGLVVPLGALVVLAVVAATSGMPAAWLAFMGAVPLFAAMFSRVPVTAVVALVTVIVAGVSAARLFPGEFAEVVPVVLGVIVLSGAAVLAAQAKAAPRPRPTVASTPAAAAPPSPPDADVDALTGLLTRGGARSALGGSAPAPRVVALIDCDHLAALNEEWGRGVGDTFVFAVAGRTRYALTEPDFVARWADQQFLVVLSGDLDQARPTLELIADKVNSNPIRTDAGLVPATMSVGAARWLPGEDLEAAVGRARGALYRGKVAGGGCLVIEE